MKIKLSIIFIFLFNIILSQEKKIIQIIEAGSFDKNEIIILLSRRPLTFDDVENTFDDESLILLNQLVENEEISIVNNNGVKFYKI